MFLSWIFFGFFTPFVCELSGPSVVGVLHDDGVEVCPQLWPDDQQHHGLQEDVEGGEAELGPGQQRGPGLGPATGQAVRRGAGQDGRQVHGGEGGVQPGPGHRAGGTQVPPATMGLPSWVHGGIESSL